MNERDKQTDLQGDYLVIGEKLTSKNLVLLIRERKQPTAKKPQKYLLLKVGDKYKYLSSLYQVGQGRFAFDTGSPAAQQVFSKVEQFILELEQTTAKIYAA